jgi:hypothetical protein
VGERPACCCVDERTLSGTVDFADDPVERRGDLVRLMAGEILTEGGAIDLAARTMRQSSETIYLRE